MDDVLPIIEAATVSKSTFFQRIFRVRHFLVIAMVAFLILASLARNTPYLQFDLTITRAIQEVSIPGFTPLMLFLTYLGNTIPAGISIAVVSLALLLLNKKAAAFFAIVSSLGLSGIGIIAKAIVARPRPDSLLINQLGFFVKPDSFPSGHVLYYIGLFGFIFVYVFTKFKKSAIRTLILLGITFLIIGIGVSRIDVGAHWFSDVLGSYLIGSVWLYFMAYLYTRYGKKKIKT